MRGHDNLIALRCSGTLPKFVFLNDYPCKTDWFENSDHVTISTHGDAISSLDLRCLFGLTVSISSESEARAKALFSKAKMAGATTVAACHIQATYPHCQTGWTEIYKTKEDKNA